MRVIAGIAKGRQLKSPKSPNVRPIMDRVKTALFDILAPEIEGARFLDLFAGAGGVGIEALSRGAEAATFVELDTETWKLIGENLRITGLGATPRHCTRTLFASSSARTPATGAMISCMWRRRSIRAWRDARWRSSTRNR